MFVTFFVYLTVPFQTHSLYSVNRNKIMNDGLGMIIFKYSVRTAKKAQHFTITKINWLTLFKEIIAVYTENHTKPINVGKMQSCCMLKQVLHITI
jgi:hypothetical protein